LIDHYCYSKDRIDLQRGRILLLTMGRLTAVARNAQGLGAPARHQRSSRTCFDCAIPLQVDPFPVQTRFTP